MESCRERMLRIALAYPDVTFVLSNARPVKIMLKLLQVGKSKQLETLLLSPELTPVVVCHRGGP